MNNTNNPALCDDLASRLIDTLIDDIENAEDQLDALRLLLHQRRPLLGDVQITLIEAEISTLTALLDIRLCRFKALGGNIVGFNPAPS